MAQLTLTLGAIGGLLGVAFGAFGAHALRHRLDDYALGVFETAVQYHFYHSLALLAVIGICIFSGSLYLLSLTGFRWLGAVTPIGGLAFIAAWACLAAAAWSLAGTQ